MADPSPLSLTVDVPNDTPSTSVDVPKDSPLTSVTSVEGTESPSTPYRIQTCKLCGKSMDSRLLLKHRVEEHKEEELAAREEGRKKAKLAEAEKEKGDVPPVTPPTAPKLSPTGIANLGDLRSRTVPTRLYSDTLYLSTRVIVWYDIVRTLDPLYKATLAEFIEEIIDLFFSEHQDEFRLQGIFQPQIIQPPAPLQLSPTTPPVTLIDIGEKA